MHRVMPQVEVPEEVPEDKSLGWCILHVLPMYQGSWMYYDCNNHVSLMYYGCIGSFTLHLCFPPYSAHHLFGAQPIRASRFGHQQPMGLAPVGWGQPRHGSTRHAFWQTGHACSSMPCWVLSCRNYCWSGIYTGPLHSMLQAWDSGLLWGAKQGPKDSEKSQWSPSDELNGCIFYVFHMYLWCIDNVL